MRTIRRREFILGTGAIGILGISATACANTESNPDQDQNGGVFELGTTVDATSWDPSLASAIHGLQYFEPVYDALIRREPDGELVPMLATRWHEAEDRLSIQLELRDDVTFSDGTEFNAEAVKLNLERMQENSGGASSRLDAVDAVEVIDAQTIDINLSIPDPALLDFLAGNVGGFIASPTAIDAGSIDTDPVGSGPYELDLDQTTRGSHYTFNRREDYWNPELQHWDQIVVRVLEAGTPILNGLLSGQVHAAQLTPKTSEPAIDAGFQEASDMAGFFGLFIMDREGELAPELADKRVRQAINHAIDKQSFLEQVEVGYGEITSSPFGPDSTAWLPELDDYYEYDPDKAVELLSEAGYENGFELTIPTHADMDPAVTATLQENLSAIGITVDWNTVTPTDYVPELRNGSFAVATFQQALNQTWRAIQTLLSPSANFNPFAVEDDEINRLAEIIQTSPVDSEESIQAAQELNRHVVEEAWYAPFYRAMIMVFHEDTIAVEPQARQGIPSMLNYRSN